MSIYNAFINGLPPNKLMLASRIVESVKQFEPTPFMLPIADELPPDAPRLVFQSKSDDSRCVLSLSRADIFANQVPPSKAGEVVKNCLQVGRVLVESRIDINRVGLVTTSLVELTEPALDYCVARFLGRWPTGDMIEVEIAYRTMEEVCGERANRWVRIRSMPKSFPNQSPGQLEVLIDHNTVDERGKILQLNTVESFLTEALTRQRQALLSLFVDGGSSS